MRILRAGWIAALALWAGGVAAPVLAQDVGVVQSDILVLDPERLFAESAFGKRFNDDYIARRAEISAQNRALQAELEAEEQALTALRAEKTAEEFSVLADEFDARVQDIRQRSDRTVRELERGRELAPVQFMRLIEPVLIDLMRETGGTVVLDTRSVLYRADVVDITDLAIARANSRIGNGQEAPAPQDEAPQPPE